VPVPYKLKRYIISTFGTNIISINCFHGENINIAVNIAINIAVNIAVNTVVIMISAYRPRLLQKYPYLAKIFQNLFAHTNQFI
jgi:hypothetical protein